jgi:2'-5' RNA ligase
VADAIQQCPAFDVEIGPLNAFPNVLIAEVHDNSQALHRLRARVRRALPLRARPPLAWKYLPHVTRGFWGRQPAVPLVEALRPYRAITPLRFHVDRVWLTVYTRDAWPGQHLLSKATEEIIAEFVLQPPR